LAHICLRIRLFSAYTKAGAHIIVAHMGLTTAGSIGAMTAATLDDSVLCVQAIADAAFGVKLISLFSITEVHAF
jgi:predicted TIM-barrel enzyme